MFSSVRNRDPCDVAMAQAAPDCGPVVMRVPPAALAVHHSRPNRLRGPRLLVVACGERTGTAQLGASLGETNYLSGRPIRGVWRPWQGGSRAASRLPTTSPLSAVATAVESTGTLCRAACAQTSERRRTHAVNTQHTAKHRAPRGGSLSVPSKDNENLQAHQPRQAHHGPHAAGRCGGGEASASSRASTARAPSSRPWTSRTATAPACHAQLGSCSPTRRPRSTTSC